jgi:hypothetical protein
MEGNDGEVRRQPSPTAEVLAGEYQQQGERRGLSSRSRSVEWQGSLVARGECLRRLGALKTGPRVSMVHRVQDKEKEGAAGVDWAREAVEEW